MHQLRSRRLLPLAMLLGLLLGAPPAAAGVPGGPDVLLLVVDDAEVGDFGCYGGTLPTPHADALAARGVRFTRACPTSTVCTPSRHTLPTGEMPTSAASVAERTPPGEPASVTWNALVSEADTALGEAVRPLGHATASVGKWHAGSPDPWHVPPRSWPGDPDDAHLYGRNAEIRSEHARRLGGFDHARHVYTHNVLSMPVSARLMGQHRHRLTHETLGLLDELAAGDRPRLLHHATTIPHPTDVAEVLETMDPRATLTGHDHAHARVQPGFADPLARVEAHGPDETREARSEAAGVLWLDDAVGRIVEALEEREQLDDTVIAPVSDHDRRGKFVLDGGRVPLIADGRVAGHAQHRDPHPERPAPGPGARGRQPRQPRQPRHLQQPLAPRARRLRGRSRVQRQPPRVQQHLRADPHDGTLWADDHILVAEGGANHNTPMISRGPRDVPHR